MKGKLITIPTDPPVEGTQVIPIPIEEGELYIATILDKPYHIRWNKSGKKQLMLKTEVKLYKQIAIEYEEWRVKGEYEKAELTTYIYPLHPSNWEEGLKLLGQEVEFKTEYSKSENKVYSKLITLPKQEETWEEIVHKVFNLNPLARIRLSVIRYKQLLDWLKENYLPPIKKKQ